MKSAFKLKPPTPLEHIAFWQFMGFLLLLGLLWADQTLDHSQVAFSHGICPDCYRRVADELPAGAGGQPPPEKTAP